MADDPAALSQGTQAVRDHLRFDEQRLAQWLRDNVAGYSGDLTVAQFKGGQSNPTYKLTTSGGGAYVMRRKPPGKLLASAHAVDREYRVISALAGTGVPVPRTYALCTDESVIGTWFYVMEFVNGRIIWDLFTNDTWREQRADLLGGSVDAIAALHNVDFHAVGLSDYGKPSNYIGRQCQLWAKQFEYTHSAQRNEPLEQLMSWVPSHIPKDDDRTTIVHGDPQVANMVFHAKEPRVVALLDWELSTLGHPTVDLAYICMSYYNNPASRQMLEDPAALGLPSIDDLQSRYCRQTGLKEVPHWHFYVIFNVFRLAAILQGIAKRAQDGTASSDQAKEQGDRAVALAASALPLLALAD